MLFLDGVYKEQADGKLRFYQTRAPTEAELAHLTATLHGGANQQWVDWFNNRRILEPIGNVPPAEFEQAHYRQQGEPGLAA